MIISFKKDELNMVHILSFINYMYWKINWCKRLHDKVSGNWQKFTTMVYGIINQGISKREQVHIWKKSFWIYNNDRKENALIYAHHISYKNIRNFCRLFELVYYTKLDKKHASKVPNNLLKSNCEFEGLGKFKMILIVNMFKILSNH